MTHVPRQQFERDYADLWFKSVNQLRDMGYYSFRCYERGHCCGWHAVAVPQGPEDAEDRERTLRRYKGQDAQPFGGPYTEPGSLP